MFSTFQVSETPVNRKCGRGRGLGNQDAFSIEAGKPPDEPRQRQPSGSPHSMLEGHRGRHRLPMLR